MEVLKMSDNPEWLDRVLKALEGHDDEISDITDENEIRARVEKILKEHRIDDVDISDIKFAKPH
jgi:hypothetical protein